jgi:hypothetical protein
MSTQLGAVQVERPLAPLSGGDLRLEIGQPARRDLREGEPRRHGQLAEPADGLE